MTVSVMLFRLDLRLSDNQALIQACKAAEEVLPLLVLDPAFLKEGSPRFKFLYGSMRALDEELDGGLVVRTGDPVKVLPKVAAEVGATEIFCTEEFWPYGRQRDDAIEAELKKHEIAFHRVDSAYAVEPGAIAKDDGTPYRVFTPYYRSWQAHGWGSPQQKPRNAKWKKIKSDPIPDDPEIDAETPEPGEKAAMRTLERFLENKVKDYATDRDFPARLGTSRLSPYLKFGCIHPRQILHKLGAGRGPSVFQSELCWREFYADVLFHNPKSMTHSLNPKMASMQLDTGKKADARFDAWSQGQTGFPIVDAGMRQLLSEAYIHNRVRMIVASFLIKDLHIDWTRGAKWFMDYLVDGDFASNTHGWQWVAGTGTDAAPYFRIFNPITQAKKFDPEGDYIKQWVPELRDLDAKLVHEPWKAKDGPPNGYPEPIVDHDTERKEALRRYSALK